MPLCNKRLDKAAMEFLHSMPEDRDCEQNPAYQTMVDIYDSKCRGCGFARLVVDCGKHKLVTSDIDKALHYAAKSGGALIRSCSYPSDLDVKFGEVVYPSLHEIVSNTCEFWYPERFPDYDGEFYEVSIQEFLKQQENKISEPIRKQ